MREFKLAKDYLNDWKLNAGELVVLENVRFNKGEKKSEEELSKAYTHLYVTSS
ncbi:phosphoglycerate kinase [Vibrio chagasii]|nr:phosphoglycerate kinase [Vibrio chagasii]